MTKHLYRALILIMMVVMWMPKGATADELGDAIRQAEQAKAESERMSRSVDEGRSKAWQLYQEVKLVKFQLASDEYLGARNRFDRAEDAFNRARYYLELFRKSGSESTLNEAQSNLRQASNLYNEGVEKARRAVDWFNGGIEEYNRQLRDERKKKAEENRTDSFNLMKSTEEMIKKIEGKPRSSATVSCLKEAYSRAQWAFGKFHSAVENADQVEAYKEWTEVGIRYYNEAVQMVKQVRETGKCKL